MENSNALVVALVGFLTIAAIALIGLVAWYVSWPAAPSSFGRPDVLRSKKKP